MSFKTSYKSFDSFEFHGVSLRRRPIIVLEIVAELVSVKNSTNIWSVSQKTEVVMRR